ncbi:MAG: chorismate lyase [Legionellaceae bacterium]|nr:chorismate lyase [Legionellaceae bacterium]
MSIEKSLQNRVPLALPCPRFLADWCDDKTFLTQKLKQHTGDARLELLSCDWMSPDWWERHFLGLSCDSVYRRQILMYSGHYPCWYARTVIPLETYSAAGDCFQRLDTESLGDIIFSDTRIQRVLSTGYAIDKYCIEYHWIAPEIAKKSDFLWLKLSEFRINGSFAFYLSEIFLPDFELCLQESGRAIGS